MIGRIRSTRIGIDDRGLPIRFLFAEIHQTHDIAGVGGGARSVGDPDIQSQQLHLRVDDRQVLHRLIIGIPEILRQQEVAVFLVLIRLDLKGLRAGTALHGHRLALRPLVGDDGRQPELAELHLRLDAEQLLSSGDQGALGCKGCITDLDLSEDILAAARIIEFQLVLEIKGGQGIVTDRHLHFIADITHHVQVGRHVEVQPPILSCPFRKGWILNVLSLVSGRQVDLSLWFDIDLTVPKEPVEQILTHRQFRLLRLPVEQTGHIGTIPEIGLLGFPRLYPHEFVEGQGCGLPVILAADLFDDDVLFGGRVIHDGISDIRRIPKVERTAAGRGITIRPSVFKWKTKRVLSRQCIHGSTCAHPCLVHSENGVGQ